MAQLASDNLTSGTTQDIVTYSSNWAYAQGSTGNIEVKSTGVFGNLNAANACAIYTGTSFPNTQYAQASIAVLGGSSSYCGLCVSGTNAGGGTYYFAYVETGFYANGVVSAGTRTNFVAPTSHTFSNGDVLYFQVTQGGSHPVLLFQQNGTTVNSYTDTANTITSGGSPGIATFGQTTSVLDAWSAGNLLAGASAGPWTLYAAQPMWAQ